MAGPNLPIPDELYLRITSSLDPRSLLLFALTHKRAFHCLQSALKRHQTWSAQYRVIHDRSPLFIPTLLTHGLLDSQAGPLWHLRLFECWGTRSDWGDWDTLDVNSRDFSLGEEGGPVESDDNTHLDSTYYSDDILDSMEAVLKTQLCLNETQTRKWMDVIRAGSDQVLKGLMIAIASNLKTLVFVAHAIEWENHPVAFLGEAISSIVESAQPIIWPPGFDSLTSISVGSYTSLQHPHDNIHCPFSVVVPFFRLPNLMNLTLNVVGYGDDHEWDLPNNSSSIKKLKLNCCEVSQGVLERLVNACRGLTHLEVDNMSITRSEALVNLVTHGSIKSSLERMNGLPVKLWLERGGRANRRVKFPTDKITHRGVNFLEDCLIEIDEDDGHENVIKLDNLLEVNGEHDEEQPYLCFEVQDLRDLNLPPTTEKIRINYSPYNRRRNMNRGTYVKLSRHQRFALAHSLLHRIVDLVEDPRYSKLREICLFEVVGVPVHLDEWNDDDTAFNWDEDVYQKIIAGGVYLHRPSKDGALTREEEQAEKGSHDEKHADPDVEILRDIHMTDPRLGHPLHAGKVFGDMAE